MKDKDILMAEKIRAASLNNQADQWKLRYFAALDGVRASQRGIKRLQRQLEKRDEYVKAAELYFTRIEVDWDVVRGGPVGVAQAYLLDARQRLGLVKKPRPEAEGRD